MTTSPSFEALLAPHLRKLYRLAYRWTGSVADAEDLLQDLLLKLYERRAELAAIAELDSWTARVLYHMFVDNARRYARRRPRVVAPEEAEGTPPDGDRALEITGVRNAVDQLSAEHRTVLLLHDAEGYKLEEIQKITGLPLGTVKSRLHRARQRLRGLLAKDGTF